VTFKNVKRSSAQRIASPSHTQGDLFGGVGGRQAKPSHPRRGGGYLHECTTSNFQKSAGAQKKRDPRLEELQEMGLQRVWLDVAEVIGVDNVIKLWRIIDSNCGGVGDDGRLLVPMRNYGTFLRYQRNRYIQTLTDLGFTAAAIKERLEKQLSEKLSVRHITRVMRKAA
jgi:hypothetical protein